MFFHNYKYRIKSMIREKEMMFWTLLFPIILGTFFNMALSNLSESGEFDPIELAIVKDGEYESKDAFLEVLESVSDNKEDDLFDARYTSMDEAKVLLSDDEVDGYIYFDKEIHVSVKSSGINQTIIKSFIDEFKQTSSTIETIIKENPEYLMNIDSEEIFDRTNFIKDVPISKNELDIKVNFFYALIAMTCMYGGLLGGNEVIVIQANQSSQGARVSVSPTHKLKLAMSAMLAATTVQLLNVGLLLLYLSVILKVNFSNQIIYVILTCIVGSITGITYGACIGALVKKKEGVKIGILIGSTMMMSFMAGLMNDKVKYMINSNYPIINKLNPVNLISDSLYSLYYYDTLDKFFSNIFTLCIFSIIFGGITYMVLRRQKYASL